MKLPEIHISVMDGIMLNSGRGREIYLAWYSMLWLEVKGLGKFLKIKLNDLSFLSDSQ